MHKISKSPDLTNATSSVLIHCHIPKTGGTSFISMAERKLGSRMINFDFYLGVIERDAYPLIRSAYFYARCISSQNARQVDIQEIWPGARFFVILRDPIERFLSAYHFHYYITGKTAENIDIVPEQKLEAESMDVYEQIPRLANVQTRFLSNNSPFHSIDEDRLNFAKQQLVKYHYVALNEQFSDIPKMLSIDFPELGKMENLSMNTTPGRKVQEKWADRANSKIVSKIRAANTFDLKLYEFAQELYEKRKQSG